MYTVFLFLATGLTLLASACCVCYTIIQMAAWIKAVEISKREWPIAIIGLASVAAAWFLLGTLFEAKDSLILYIVLGLIAIIPFFLPTKCYQFSVYYTTKWLSWFGRWRTLLLLIFVCVCSYFAGYSIRWREQYRLDNAKMYVIQDIETITNLADDVDYVTATGGDGIITQVISKIEETTLINLESVDSNEQILISVANNLTNYRNYEEGDTVYVFNEKIIHSY